MNRSILIVTCDFLVLAAMSLSIGMTEVGNPEAEANISSPATSLVEMIDEELARHEEVKRQKEELEKRLEEFRELALRDEKQIASRDDEIAQAQAKLAETLAALTKTKDDLSAEKAKSEQERAKSAAELAKTKDELTAEKAKSEQERAKSAAELAKTKDELSAEKAKSEQELAKSAAELAKTKDELTAEKAKSEQELAKSAAELAGLKQELASEKAKYGPDGTGIAAELVGLKKELDDREAALKRSAAVIAQKEIELQLSAQEILERDKAIRESENLLEQSELNLAQANKEKAGTADKLRQSENTLSRTSGQLELTKLELEAMREQARIDRARADEAVAKFHAAELELAETRSKLTSTETQLNGMVRVLTDINSDLTRTKTDLNESRQTLAATQETLAVTQETLAQNEKIIDEKEKRIADKTRDLDETRKEAAELKKKLNNDVLTSYNASVVELSFHLVNERLFNNFSIDKSFFLPAVKIGGGNWLVSAFRDTTGLNLHSGYTKVIELQYKMRRPQSRDSWAAVSGPALCLAEDTRVCLFPVGDAKADPIRPITFDELRERGVDNLTLFKSGTFSKDSADITGRCSVSMERGDNFLYIRNPNRSSSEIRAEVGDIVLSKEGLFVGVVVKVSSTDLGQTSTALCYVFPGEPDLTKAVRLRLTKERSQSIFYDFVEGHEALRKRAEQLDRGK